MKIKILGPGCKNCVALEQRTLESLDALGIEPDVVKVTDLAEIASYGVMRTPALVIDDEVVVTGRVPTTRDITAVIAGRQKP
ncbi:MAG: thioredoxin family protein [Actinobacteria bacterium]|nr:thioredoxin family protein [Actinomycetota bacterium]